MKILHIAADVSAASGVGTFVRRINDELNNLGVDSSILTRVEDLETKRRGIESAPCQLIVHVHGMWLGLHHAAAKWAKAHGAKFVWSTHGMTAPWAMHHKWWKKLPAWIAYQKGDLQSADLIHSTSAQEVKWNEKIGLKKQCLVPLGTDLPSHSLTSTSTSTKTLLFVGRVYPVKALDRLIKAFALAKTEGWKLRIVGPDEGGHLDELKNLVNSTLQLQLRTSTSPVEFAGPKYGAELEAEYAACDALALVSHTENFGATVVDAMAHAKPVITSTNTPWSVVKGACGWWVDNEPEILAKAIEELMAMSDEERAAMGANGRRLVEERFTWPAVGKAMLAEYENLG